MILDGDNLIWLLILVYYSLLVEGGKRDMSALLMFEKMDLWLLLKLFFLNNSGRGD